MKHILKTNLKSFLSASKLPTGRSGVTAKATFGSSSSSSCFGVLSDVNVVGVAFPSACATTVVGVILLVLEPHGELQKKHR